MELYISVVCSYNMLKRDRRYEYIKTMFNDGKIQSFNDIFGFIPKTVVATDIGKKVDRFSELMKRIEGFTLKDLFLIGTLCDLTESQMLKLAEKEYLLQKKSIGKQKENHKV